MVWKEFSIAGMISCAAMWSLQLVSGNFVSKCLHLLVRCMLVSLTELFSQELTHILYDFRPLQIIIENPMVKTRYSLSVFLSTNNLV